MNIYVSHNSEEFGPYSIEDVRIDFACGCLLSSDLARYEDATEWIPLDSFLRLYVHVPEESDTTLLAVSSEQLQALVQPAV